MISYIRKTDEKQRWLLASTLLNAFLALSKLVWGWQMNSTLVTADGIHSLSDVFGALLIFIALHFAAHKSKLFPYGLHKLEDMAAVLGGLGILLAGYEIIDSVFFNTGIKTPETIWTTVGFILAIITIQYLFYTYELKAAQRLNSPGVKADAINWLGDIGAGSIVVIGLIAHNYSLPYAQEVSVVVIVLMIFKGAFDVLKEGLLSLLDAADIQMNQQITDLLMQEPTIVDIKFLSVRKAGSVYFANIELRISDVNVNKAHENIDLIVNKLHTQIENLEAVTIHYEPQGRDYKMHVKLYDENKIDLSKHFGQTAWLELLYLNQDNVIIRSEFIPNEALNSSKGKAFKLVAFLLSIHTDKIIMAQADLDENILILFDALNITLEQIGAKDA